MRFFLSVVFFLSTKIYCQHNFYHSIIGDSIITPQGVGKMKVGECFPLMISKNEFISAYNCKYVADAQPQESFSLPDKNIIIIFKDGPFHKASENKLLIKYSRQHFAQKAYNQTKQCLKINQIRIKTPMVKTSKGIRVGSTFEELKNAYPEITYSIIPSDEIADALIIVAHAEFLPQVYFVFNYEKKLLEPQDRIVEIFVLDVKE